MICTHDPKLSVQKQKRNTIHKESSQKELILLCIECLYITLTRLQKIPNSPDSTSKTKSFKVVSFSIQFQNSQLSHDLR